MGVSKSVQVLFNGIEAHMALTFFDNSAKASPVQEEEDLNMSYGQHYGYPDHTKGSVHMGFYAIFGLPEILTVAHITWEFGHFRAWLFKRRGVYGLVVSEFTGFWIGFGCVGRGSLEGPTCRCRWVSLQSQCVHVCLKLWLYVCTYACMRVCMHVRMYGWMDGWFVCMYVCIVCM